MFWVLILIALLVSSLGFYKYVYFISLGYAFSISALGIVMTILFHKSFTVVMSAICVLLIVYGCRLGGYLLVREIKSASYRATMKKEVKDGTNLKLIAKLGMWGGCALLYFLQVSPVFFRLRNGKTEGRACIVGMIIMILGICLESMADFQKTKAKKRNPETFCGEGLFRIVRCPNYFGEILFWTGVIVTGIDGVQGLQWIPALAGYICIVYIMFGGARRLELRQNRNYGKNPEYQRYVKETPIIIPLVPLYSVAKYKWLLG